MGNGHHLGGRTFLLVLCLSVRFAIQYDMLLYLAAEICHEMQQSQAQIIICFEIILDLFPHVTFII